MSLRIAEANSVFILSFILFLEVLKESLTTCNKAQDIHSIDLTLKVIMIPTPIMEIWYTLGLFFDSNASK